MFLSPDQFTTKPHVLPFLSPKLARYSTEHYKLRRSLKNYIVSRPGVVELGDDPLVAQLASAAGFKSYDLVITRVISAGNQFTLVAVPTRIWRNSNDHRLLLELKAEARSYLSRCLLIPQRWLRAACRENIAITIAHAHRVQYSAADRKAIVRHLLEVKHSCIETCAALLDHPDPYGVVLAMSAAGDLSIDRNSRLGPATAVFLPTENA